MQRHTPFFYIRSGKSSPCFYQKVNGHRVKFKRRKRVKKEPVAEPAWYEKCIKKPPQPDALLGAQLEFEDF